MSLTGNDKRGALSSVRLCRGLIEIGESCLGMLKTGFWSIDILLRVSPLCVRSICGFEDGDNGDCGCDRSKADLVRAELGREGMLEKLFEFRLNKPFSDCLLKAANSGLDSIGTCLGLSVEDCGAFQFWRA